MGNMFKFVSALTCGKWNIRPNGIYIHNLTCDRVPKVVRTLFRVCDNLSAPDRKTRLGCIGGNDTEERFKFAHLFSDDLTSCFADLNEYGHSLSNRSWRLWRVILSSSALFSDFKLISLLWKVKDWLLSSERIIFTSITP